MPLSGDQHRQWLNSGFIVIPGAFDARAMTVLHEAARELAVDLEAGRAPAGPYAVTESVLDDPAKALPEKLSKIFRVHRACAPFRALTDHVEVLDWVAELVGANADCFLSQFIFKLPGALGQPWHQDAFYFPFSGPPQLGLWIAVTDAALDNGPLWVLPGSHVEPVHRAERDPRAHANPAYYEIRDHDFSAAQPMLMNTGDALLFHGRLMHKSTDNESSRRRAAMVYHFATSDTLDHSIERFGKAMPNVDWMPLLRNGRPVSTR
jgi:phytanoyl-CoA hydroxylase